MKKTIAAKEGVPENAVVCGTGVPDLIAGVVRTLAPKRALVVVPTRSSFEEALVSVGCEVEKFLTPPVYNEYGRLCAQSFTLTADVLKHIPRDLDVLCLSSPNNPTGQSAEPALLKNIFDVCQAQGTRVLWDASSIDFMDLEDGINAQEKAEQFLVSCVKEYENLVAFQSLSNAYVLTETPLGCLLCSDFKLNERFLEDGLSDGVTAEAQAAGVAALRDHETWAMAQRYISEEKLQLWLGLLRMGRCFCRRGDGNYLLLWTEHADLARRLNKRGIPVQDCSDLDGLDEHYLQVTIGTRQENKKLYEALWQELKGGEQDG